MYCLYEFTNLQVSSLLRDDENESTRTDTDEIQFHVRKFDSQSRSTRLCGFYAVAAAVSCCFRKDPTGSLYDETLFRGIFQNFMLSDDEVHEPFPCLSVCDDIKTVLLVAKSMLYCICHEPYKGDPMIQCTFCGYWFHVQCIPVSSSPLQDANKEWACPSCSSSSKKVVKNVSTTAVSVKKCTKSEKMLCCYYEISV